MSSSATPYGMIPTLGLSSTYNTQGFDTYEIVDGYATAIYFGDVVKMATTGYIQKDTGTTTLTPWGVFMGCRYIEPATGFALDSQYWPASVTTGLKVYAKVMTNPFGVFQIQGDAATTIAAIGANAAIVQTAGTAAIGKSRNALSVSSINTTDTLPLRIVGLAAIPNNEWTDTYPDMLVKFNNHQLTTLLGI